MFSKKVIVLCLFLILGGLICAGTASAYQNTDDFSKIFSYEYGAPVTDPIIHDPNPFLNYSSEYCSHHIIDDGSTGGFQIGKKQFEDFSKVNESMGKVGSKVVNNVSVSAPVVKNKFKKSAFFKMNLKDSKNKVLKNIKLNVKVFTGKKYKNFTVKTNSKGIAKLNTKSLKKGVHKVIINSLNKKYNINKKGNLIIIK